MRNPFRALLYSTRETLGQDLIPGNALASVLPAVPAGCKCLGNRTESLRRQDLPSRAAPEHQYLGTASIASPSLPAAWVTAFAHSAVVLALLQRFITPTSLDGHLTIDTDIELVEIPLDVTASIGPRAMIHVEETAEAIADRREQDTTRKRPLRAADALSNPQARSRDLCRKYGEALVIEIHVIGTASSAALRASASAYRGGKELDRGPIRSAECTELRS
jgi:hypothetical protein